MPIFGLVVIIFLKNIFFPKWQNIFLETNIKPNFQAFDKKLVQNIWENIIQYFPQYVYIASYEFLMYNLVLKVKQNMK